MYRRPSVRKWGVHLDRTKSSLFQGTHIMETLSPHILGQDPVRSVHGQLPPLALMLGNPPEYSALGC